MELRELKHRLLKPVVLFKDTTSLRHTSWLELFIDLGFVIALASLETVFVTGITYNNLFIYVYLFFIIAWVWSRLTWYSSQYGNNDLVYKLCFLASVFLTLGMTSALGRSGGMDFQELTIWYILIESVLLFLWIRAVIGDKEHQRHSYTFLIGQVISLLLICLSLFTPLRTKLILWTTATLIEMVAPVIGWYIEKGKIYVHTSHIMERYGLFIIILLGEGLTAVLELMRQPFQHHLLLVCVMEFCVLALLWWIYFSDEEDWTNLSQHLWRTVCYRYGISLLFIAIMLVIFSFNTERRHPAEDIYYSGIWNSAQLLWFGTGLFLTVMGAIQYVISELKTLRPLYVFRIITGAVMLGLSFIRWQNFLLILCCCVGVLTVSLIFQAWFYVKQETARASALEKEQQKVEHEEDRVEEQIDQVIDKEEKQIDKEDKQKRQQEIKSAKHKNKKPSK
ncbi:MAG: low temperature requirement protein A [Marinifilaceae bacterium]